MTVLLDARDVTVDYPGVRALDRVSMRIESGEVIGVVGANGSGKTTLLSVLCGVRQPSSGTLGDGAGPVRLASPRDALDRGISLVPSEPQLAVSLACWENLTLGQPAPLGLLLGRARRAEAEREMAAALPSVSPTTIAGDLKKSDRALLALLIALRRNPRVLGLDEPTAVLGEAGVQVVGDAIRRVRATGGAVVLVSHRLRDILQLATTIVVLVDGRVTYQGPAGEVTPTELVARLTEGRAETIVRHEVHAGSTTLGEPVVQVRNARTATRLDVERLEVRSGEIVGVAGLSGSGRSRLLRYMAGDVVGTDGAATYRGQPYPVTLRAARRAGIAYVPEDRIRDAMFAPLSVTANLNAGELVDARSLATPIDRGGERRRAAELVATYGIRAPRMTAPVTTLSSGNQQRVLLARELSRQPTFLVADEPTQGVDSGGRRAIHSMLGAYVAGGGSVLMASSDFDELRELCHRIVVLRDAAIVGDFDAASVSTRELLELATGASATLLPFGSAVAS